MQLPNELTDAQHRAIVEAIRILASRGRQVRLEREARERAAQEMATPTKVSRVGDGESDGAADHAATTESET